MRTEQKNRLKKTSRTTSTFTAAVLSRLKHSTSTTFPPKTALQPKWQTSSCARFTAPIWLKKYKASCHWFRPDYLLPNTQMHPDFVQVYWKRMKKCIFKECFSCGNLVPQSQTRIWLRTTCGHLKLSIARIHISCSFIFCLWCVLLIKINRTNGLRWPSSSRAARWAPDKHWWWSCRSSLRNSSGSQFYPWWSVGSYIASRKGT